LIVWCVLSCFGYACVGTVIQDNGIRMLLLVWVDVFRLA
jgi:hypothetical protein